MNIKRLMRALEGFFEVEKGKEIDMRETIARLEGQREALLKMNSTIDSILERSKKRLEGISLTSECQ